MNKKKILIIDDEVDISYFLSRSLRKSNYETFVALNLAEAESLISKEVPAIVLLDNHLPDGFGIDFAAIIKQTFPNIKILMLTAHNSPQDKQKAINNGVDVFISKPFKVDDIVSIVKGLEAEPDTTAV